MNPSESKAGIRTRYNRTHAVCFCLGSSKESELIPVRDARVELALLASKANRLRTRLHPCKGFKRTRCSPTRTTSVRSHHVYFLVSKRSTIRRGTTLSTHPPNLVIQS